MKKELHLSLPYRIIIVIIDIEVVLLSFMMGEN